MYTVRAFLNPTSVKCVQWDIFVVLGEGERDKGTCKFVLDFKCCP